MKIIHLFKSGFDGRSQPAPAAPGDTLERLWRRYVRAAASESGAVFEISGKEYEAVLLRYRFDPRAAAIYFDLRVSVLADQLVDTSDVGGLTYGEKHMAQVLTQGVTYELACMKYLGSIPGYPENTLEMSDEDWQSFAFVRESDTARPMDYVVSARIDALRIPDYSNILDLPEGEALDRAN